jgi:hypothetical protein
MLRSQVHHDCVLVIRRPPTGLFDHIDWSVNDISGLRCRVIVLAFLYQRLPAGSSTECCSG